MKNIVALFYDAFNNLDTETMVGFYHPDIEFEDPAFGKLRGERAKNMWRNAVPIPTRKRFSRVVR